MNKRHLALSLSAFIALAGCTLDERMINDEVVPSGRKMTIEAVRENLGSEEGGLSTRTIRDEESGSVLWVPGDAISLFYGSGANGGSKFTSTLESGSSEMTNFTGTITAITGGGELTVDDTYFWGVYPYGEDVSCDGQGVTMTVPTSQEATPGTFAPNTFPSVGRSQGLIMGFYNICGGWRFSVTKEGIKKVTLKSNGGEPITGKVKVKFDAAGIPMIEEILEGSDEVVLEAPSGEYFEVGKNYYMILLPTVFESGFTMTFETNTESGEYNRTKKTTIARSKFSGIANLDNYLTTPYAKKANAASLNDAQLEFIPQVLVSGVPGVKFKKLNAMVYRADRVDSKDEIWFNSAEAGEQAFLRYLDANGIDSGTVTESVKITWLVEQGYMISKSLPALVQYHVNYGLDLDDTYEYSLSIKDVPVNTRSASEDFFMKAEFVSYDSQTKILTLSLEYVGFPATADNGDNDMTLFALKVSKGGESCISGYSTLVVDIIESPVIANPIAQVKATPGTEAKLKGYNYEEHYRRGTVGISGNDDGDYYGDYEDWNKHELFTYEYVAPWSENNTLEEAHASCDTAVAWNTTIGLDLNTITIAHYVPENGFCFELTPAEMEEFGLHFEYEVVKNYKVGKPETDQSNFVKHKNFKIEDGIFWPAVYDVDGTASIGRTPIIRVKLMHGEDIINVAYIKVFITG